MAITIEQVISKKEYEGYWDQLDAHILQSWQWIELKSGQDQPIRLVILEEDKPVALISSTIKKIRSIVTIAYAPKVYLPEKYIEEILPKLEVFFREKKYADIVVFDFINDKFSKINISTLLQTADKSLQPQWTDIINLDVEEEGLWMGMKGTYRRNIKKSVRHGVKVEVYEQSEQALDYFYEVMQSVFKNTKYIMHGKDYFQKVWEQLNSIDMCRIFIARIDDQVIGAYLVAMDKIGAYELYGGVTRQGRQLEAGYTLKWEAIKYMNKFGKKTYDHWGVASKNDDGKYDKSDELYHISNFKKGFGGEFVEYMPSKQLILDHKKYYIYKGLLKVKSIKLSILKTLK